jgi:hypothetical protein
MLGVVGGRILAPLFAGKSERDRAAASAGSLRQLVEKVGLLLLHVGRRLAGQVELQQAPSSVPRVKRCSYSMPVGLSGSSTSCGVVRLMTLPKRVVLRPRITTPPLSE